MSVHIPTTRAQNLLGAIKSKIDKKEIQTWSYDSDGDFTHTPSQWQGKAWFRPSDAAGELVLGILAPKGTKLPSEIYAVYHGRFIEMMLAHFDSEFERAWATAMPTAYDTVG